MRKAILLAMAAAIVAMFATPGSASAAWTKHHVASTENFELEITGTDLFFETEVGGVTCQKTISKVLFEVGTTGTVTSFESELNSETPTITSNCQGRGLLAQCDVHEATAHARHESGGTDPQDLRWIIHTATPDTVTITTGTITNTLTGFFCPHTLKLTPGTVTMTVPTEADQTENQTRTTKTATLSGNLVTDGDLGNNIATTVSGTVHVLGTITYGI